MTTIALSPPPTIPVTGFKATCKQVDLARALSMVSRAVLPNSTKPILSTILLAVDGKRLRVSATNLEIGIQVWVEVQHLEGQGATTLPADLLNKVIGLMPNEALDLAMPPGSQTLTLRCAGNATAIRAKDDPEQFPRLPDVQSIAREGGLSSPLEASLLKTIIGQVAFAADQNSAREALTAVRLQVLTGTCTLAAANTYRLVEREATLATRGTLPVLLVPGRNFRELERILPETGQVTILVAPQQNQVVFHYEQHSECFDFVSRLIDGTYPDYRRAIPQEFHTHTVVETSTFKNAVRLAALFDTNGGTLETVKIEVTPRGEGSLWGQIEVPAAADTGQTASVILADVTGPGGSITFPVKYLIEALDHIDSPQVRFSFLDSGKPGVFKPVNDMAYTSMVMSAKPRESTI